MEVMAAFFSLEVLFNVAALFMLLGAGITVFSRNPMHSLLGLLLAFVQAAILCIAMGAPFFGLLLVMIYVGAIAVMFLFVIMTVRFDEALKPAAGSVFWSCTLGMVLLVQLYYALRLSVPLSLQTANPQHMPSLENLATLMFTQYIVELHIVALVLLVAMVGAIVLVGTYAAGNTRTQNPAQQVRRKMGVKMMKGGKI